MCGAVRPAGEANTANMLCSVCVSCVFSWMFSVPDSLTAAHRDTEGIVQPFSSHPVFLLLMMINVVDQTSFLSGLQVRLGVSETTVDHLKAESQGKIIHSYLLTQFINLFHCYQASVTRENRITSCSGSSYHVLMSAIIQSSCQP